MPTSLTDLPAHSMRSLLPALGVMESLGFTRQACLKGTGVLVSQLEDPQGHLTLQQELAFYRNTLELSDDPTIGLKLGEPFLPQRYGLFGYALLSAATLRHVFSLADNFGRLTFSFFTFHFGVTGSSAWFSLEDPPPLPQELVDLYQDRDMSATQVDFSEILGKPFVPRETHLTHNGHGKKQVYRDHFGGDVYFGADRAMFVLDSALLDAPLPRSDPESSRHFQHQCQMLVAKLRTRGNFIDDVRMLILARPGYFPDIDYVAEKLGISTRTLRRRLSQEGSSYRAELDEVRYGLAREYIGATRLPIDEVAELLGYSETANFSHAFRRWSGVPPTVWRQANAQ